jgi:probable FeS assembly SUF system protein SufT
MRSQSSTWITLERDVEAVTIPGGEDVTLPEGDKVIVQQEMGAQFTLRTQRGHLVRIEAADADAIGREPPSEGEHPEGLDEDRDLEEMIWDQLHDVYDPEIPVDVVELGLIYDLEIDQLEDGGHAVSIDMTLTAPGCGMGDVLAADAKEKVAAVPDVEEVDVEIVFDPPWTPDRMSDEARLELGFF